MQAVAWRRHSGLGSSSGAQALSWAVAVGCMRADGRWGWWASVAEESRLGAFVNRACRTLSGAVRRASTQRCTADGSAGGMNL